MSNVAEVRAWARTQGIEVGTRGRISKDLIAKFEAAQAQPVEVAA